MNKNKKIGVLMGGRSREREISLRTGKAILSALERKGYAAEAIQVDADFIEKLPQLKIDIAFIALHGPFGEDGRIQALLEWRGIPYTGSGVLTSALCMRKDRLKRFLGTYGVPMAKDWIYEVSNRVSVAEWMAQQSFHYPVVVKPASEGSSIGMTRVFAADEMESALIKAAQLDRCVVVEAYISGRELTVGVLNGEVLPILEVVPEGGVYDYHAKYEVKTTRYLFPEDLPQAVSKRLITLSADIFKWIDARGAVRIDWMWDPSNKEPQFLEVNTIPGMTETSLLPKAAAKVGISFDDLVEKILGAVET